ncbi:8157_t:CDS:2 [Diversispora eburnea]|uniref:8157_t:CDS:1 n=1 Tax=Diversispora eburnea TaxID=1213867 RepID=A0A9N8VE08_9GLOM|nr:8157_t:CDS:2 [Diversispora eburnea]
MDNLYAVYFGFGLLFGLYSSSLVSRVWCKIAIPLLWELPFGQECCTDNKNKLKKKALCIRTYISCMDTQVRTLLIQNGFDLSSVQKRLEILSIGSNYNLDYNSIFSAIISQKETLKSLRLRQVEFFHFEWNSLPFDQFISLQELYIEDCYGLFNSDCLFLASLFTQLSSFHYKYKRGTYPQEFIIKIFETANTNLKNIYLDLHPTISFDTAILNYCTNITKLTLLKLRPEQIISIFNSDFNELRRLSFDCRGEGFDADELLYKMAENVPESLETIEIRMEKFSVDSLRKFMKGWSCKERGGNKKIIVKRKKEARLCDEHFKVIEEYGVQFKVE